MSGPLTAFTPDELVKAFVTTRNFVEAQVAQLADTLAPHKQLMQAIEAEMLSRSLRDKTKSYSTESGTCYQSHLQTAKVKDPTTFKAWLRTQPEQVQDAMTTAAVSKEGVYAWIEEHTITDPATGRVLKQEVPPGLEIGGVTKMNFRAK